MACIILEPARTYQPENGYLHKVRDIADEYGVVLIFDETVTGFRYSRGGAQEYFGVTPDMGVFGKAMGNGFPLTCVAGKADVMMACKDSFISSCFWGDTTSLAAGVAALTFIRDNPVIEHIWSIGQAIVDGVGAAAKENGVPMRFPGKPCNPFCPVRHRRSGIREGHLDALGTGIAAAGNLRRRHVLRLLLAHHGRRGADGCGRRAKRSR